MNKKKLNLRIWRFVVSSILMILGVMVINNWKIVIGLFLLNLSTGIALAITKKIEEYDEDELIKELQQKLKKL